MITMHSFLILMIVANAIFAAIGFYLFWRNSIYGHWAAFNAVAAVVCGLDVVLLP